MRVNANTARCSPSLRINILVAESRIGPRPAGTYHQRLQVVIASKADRDGTVILVVIVDLVTRHWAASGRDVIGQLVDGDQRSVRSEHLSKIGVGQEGDLLPCSFSSDT
jgi:hypothetical protein